MNASAVLDEVRSYGGQVFMGASGRLHVEAPAPLPDSLVDRLRHSKREIIKLLQQAGLPPEMPAPYIFDERAAIIEADGVDRAWAEGFATLCTMPRPSAYSQSRWDQILNDGGLFLDRWKGTVLALGWLSVDVFGVCPDAPVWRLDQMGLVPLLEGRRVIDITADTARIDCGQGVIHTYRRLPRDMRGVCLWELEQKVKQLQKDDGK